MKQDNNTQQKTVPVSVVCASHQGLDRLPGLISSVFFASVIPDEMVICVTDVDDSSKVDRNLIDNYPVTFIVSEVKSQVHQRKTALAATRNKIIIQLDDDVLIEESAVEKFYSHFQEGSVNNNKIVCAKLVFPNGKLMSYRWNYLFDNSCIFRGLMKLLNGFENIPQMSILKSGRIAPKLLLDNGPLEDAQWVSSIIAYHRDALMDGESLKIMGKGYYEDVFFTHSLYTKGYQLIIDDRITITHPVTPKSDLHVFLHSIDAQRQIVRRFNKSRFLFSVDVIVFFNLYLLGSLKSRFISLFKK